MRLRREPLAALGAAAPQHVPAGARAHARTEPVGACALALLGLIGALHRDRDRRAEDGCSRRERRVHDGARSGRPVTPSTLFSRNAGNPAGGAASRSGAVVSSARRGQRWRSQRAVPLSLKQSSRTRPPGGSRHVCARPTRSALGRHPRRAPARDPDFKFHIWIEPLELAAVERQDALRPRARAHPHLGRASATCPCCGAPPRAASTPTRSSRSSGRPGRSRRPTSRAAGRGAPAAPTARASTPSTASTSS